MDGRIYLVDLGLKLNLEKTAELWVGQIKQGSGNTPSEEESSLRVSFVYLSRAMCGTVVQKPKFVGKTFANVWRTVEGVS